MATNSKRVKKEFTIEGKIMNIIPLTKNRFAGVGEDIIYIYSGDAPYNKEPIAKLEGHKKMYDRTQLLQLKGKEILLSAKERENIILWDLNTYTQIKQLPIGKEWAAIGLIMQIDEDNIMMSRYIFTISTGTIKDLGCDFIRDGFVRSEGKIVGTYRYNRGDWGYSVSFIVYDPKTGNLEITDWKDLWYINSIVVLDDHTFVAGCTLVYSVPYENLKIINY